MPNTLGLDDDWDDVEVVRDLERAFDIVLTTEETQSILTVGEFYDLLLRKLVPGEGDGKCATAMAFYRIRRALRSLGYGHDLTPATDLRFLEQGSTASNLRRVRAKADLFLPATTLSPGAGLVSVCWILLSTIVAYRIDPGLSSTVSGFALGLVMALPMLAYVDPGKLPSDCRTLAGFTRKVAALNYGQLAMMGARHRAEDTWNVLVEVLSQYALPKSEIARDTYFLESQFRKHAKGR